MGDTPADNVALRAEISLTALRLFLDDLPGLDEEWVSLDDYNQTVLTMRWFDLMFNHLARLDDYVRAGQLTPGQSARLAALKHDLKALLPLVRKLNWYRPPRSLLEDVA